MSRKLSSSSSFSMRQPRIRTGEGEKAIMVAKPLLLLQEKVG